MNTDVCAIVVTYNPDFRLFGAQIESLDNQCAVLVVDNSEKPDIKNLINKKCQEFCIKLVDMGCNVGLAKAQNSGIQFVRDAFPESKYIVFLDQDSIPSSRFITSMRSEYKCICKKERIAVLGPSLYDPRAKSYHSFHLIHGALYKKTNPVTLKNKTIPCSMINSSGSFCSVDVFEDIGCFDESLFIDHVETDWCFRAKSMGYKLYGTTKVVLEHYMGDDVLEFSVLGKKRFMPYRNPLRHHYLFRNSIKLLKRDYIPFVWKLYCMVKLTYTAVIFSIFSRERKGQMKAMWLGIKDGISGAKGKIP